MAVDMFLKIANIKGESTDAKHKDEIEVLSWSWGVSNPGTGHAGGGAGAGKVALSDLNLMKRFDLASTSLTLACCQGTHIPEATLTVRKSAPAIDYYTIAMKDVLVASVAVSASEGDGIFESVSLSFSEVKVTYTPTSKTGKALPPVSVGWDVLKNKKM